MARDPRLALTQNLRQLAHRELGVSAQRQQSEPGGLPRRPEAAQQAFHEKASIWWIPDPLGTAITDHTTLLLLTMSYLEAWR